MTAGMTVERRPESDNQTRISHKTQHKNIKKRNTEREKEKNDMLTF